MTAEIDNSVEVQVQAKINNINQKEEEKHQREGGEKGGATEAGGEGEVAVTAVE